MDHAGNGLIYGYSWYLDNMSENWDALVMNDYEAVMPLTWNKKWGIRYLRQPAFTQQLGIFGNIDCNVDITQAFLTEALIRFPFAEINLNSTNFCKNTTSLKSNFILPLNAPFNEIKKKFKKDFVKKIEGGNLHYESSGNIDNAVHLFRKNYSKRLSTTSKDFARFLRLCYLIKNKQQLLIRRVTGGDGNLLSIAVFFNDQRRLYYIMSATLPEGRKAEANYFLLYSVIREFSGQNLILDFEGSEIPSIKLFFKKFGSVNQPYPFITFNRLPYWIKWLKRISAILKSGRIEKV